MTSDSRAGVWFGRAGGALLFLAITRAIVLTSSYPAPVRRMPASPRASASAPRMAITGVPVTLDGSSSHRSELEFWTADGDGPTENHIVTYSDSKGFGTIGPLVDFRSQPFGWPTDLLLIDGQLIGVDAWRKWLYVINPVSGYSEAWYRPGRFKGMYSLAYDPGRNVIFTVDNDLHVLAAARRSDWLFGLRTGWFRSVGPVHLGEVTGLAFDPETRQLIAYEQKTATLHWLDPDTGATTRQLRVSMKPLDEAFYDELTEYEGGLYGMLRWESDAVGYSQIHRIDTTTGDTIELGPVVSHVSAHALVLLSLPEDVEWQKVSGPGDVEFGNRSALTTTASFSSPGDYVLRLTLAKAGRSVSASELTISVTSNTAPRP
jgi:hypothetical protein